MRGGLARQIIAMLAAGTLALGGGTAAGRLAQGNEQAPASQTEEDKNAVETGTTSEKAPGKSADSSSGTDGGALQVAKSFIRERLLGSDPQAFSEVEPGFPDEDPAEVYANLDDVVNLGDFEYMSEEWHQILSENGFVVREGWSHEFFNQYEDNRYDLTPSFVTTDAMMHTYHLYFSHLLKKTEKEHLLDDLTVLTQEMLEKSAEQYEVLQGGEFEQAALRSVGFFEVAANLLGAEVTLPEELADLTSEQVEEELALIEAQGGLDISPLFGAFEDYSQYKPRGYYDTDEDLSRYFKAMMWYGRMNFTQREEDLDRTALLILLAMDEDTLPTWKNLYATTAFFAGESDDAGYYEYRPLIDEAYGEDITAAELTGDTEGWEKYHALTGSMPAPQINSMPIYDESIEPDRDEAITGYRFMGQRFTLDASIFQNLIYRSVKENSDGLRRMLPDALDIPAALGNDEALSILEEQGATEYELYTENMEKLRSDIEGMDESFWNRSLYNGWLSALLPLLEEDREGYPAFMRTKAWTRKNLSSFLGSWIELKHDTVLYGKQVFAEMGGGWEEEKDDRGYVEPEPTLFLRLALLADKTAEGLDAMGYLSEEDADNLSRLSVLSTSLQTIAEKELSGILPDDDEFELIRTIGGQLEHFWYECIKDQADNRSYVRSQEFPAALIVDVATDPDSGLALEVGTGSPGTIYVVVEVDGIRKIALGSVFTFYEFEQPIDDRLTDSEWRVRMAIDWTENGYNDADPVDPPEWTQDYLIKRK